MLKVQRILLIQDTNEPVSVTPQIVDQSINENEEDGNATEAKENEDEIYDVSSAEMGGIYVGSAMFNVTIVSAEPLDISFNDHNITMPEPEKTYLPKLTGKRLILINE